MDAQVIFQRHHVANVQDGPAEYGVIGFRVEDRIFTVGSYCFPGTSSDQYRADVALAERIVAALKGAE